MKIITKTALIIIGSISLSLGFLGVFLPLLPTTPFLLLAAACYSRSSEKFYEKLVSSKVLGRYIRYYREGKGITLNAKALSIALLWFTIGYTTLFAVSHIVVRILLVSIAAGVTIHILHIKTYKEIPDADYEETKEY